LRSVGLKGWLGAAFGAVVAIVLVLVVPAGAATKRHLHGLILATTPARGQVIVRHDAFAGMPSMSMPFSIVPRHRAAELLAGNTIDADVDITTEPWTLSNVRIAETQSLTTEPALRKVPPMKIGDPLPLTPLLDQTGRQLTFGDFRGKQVVLAFIYTRCQDPRMCPLITAKFNRLAQLVDPKRVQLVEVTLDPSFDRPDVLARYGKTFGADSAHWSLLTGDSNAVLDLAARFGIGTLPDAESHQIIHGEDTVLIGPDGRVQRMIYETAWSPDEIVSALAAARGAGGNPIQRFALWLKDGAVAVCGNGVNGFSGIADLGIVFLIFGAFGYILFRLARKIFVENP